jgi:hypothetical protein
MTGITYGAGTGNIGRHNSGQHLHIKDFFHSCAKLEMGGDGPGPQIDHPKPTPELLAIAYDRDSFERWPGFRKPDEGVACVECQTARNARYRSHWSDSAGLGVGHGQIALAGVEKEDLIAFDSRGVREGQAAGQKATAGNLDETAAIVLDGAPAGGRVGFR